MFKPRKQRNFSFIFGLENYHRVLLKTGHEIEIWWSRGNEIYSAKYNSRNSGGINIGCPTLRELMGKLRSQIAEDIDPDIGIVRRRVVGEVMFAVSQEDFDRMRKQIDKIARIPPRKLWGNE